MKVDIVENKIIIKDRAELVFDDIEFIDKIGRGANGICFKARTKYPNREVAFKLWLPRRGFAYPDRERFVNEINKIIEVDHTNIVKIHNANIIDGYCYAIYELVEGTTLEEWLKEEHDYFERHHVLVEIISVLRKLDQKGVYHGDLHSNNILIRDITDVKIIDFGTSIFSGHHHSKKRDKRIIWNTLNAITYELKTNLLIETNYSKFTHAEIFEAIFVLSTGYNRLIGYKNDKIFDSYSKGDVVACFNAGSRNQLINYNKVWDLLRKHGFENCYYKRLLIE
ncbi:serine/threonine protein kinase [Wukongibacter baidiensis]